MSFNQPKNPYNSNNTFIPIQHNNDESNDTVFSIAPDHNSHYRPQYQPNIIKSQPEVAQSRTKKILEMAQVCVGIYVSFVVLSFFQEKITRRPYGGDENQEFFNFPMFLVFLQCVCNAGTAYGKMWVTGKHKLTKSEVPYSFYAVASFSYIVAFVSSNAALLYINYPTQVLAKSCKMIPVVLMGFLFARKSYSVQQLVAVGLISLGITAFMFDRFGSKHKSAADNAHDNNFYGIFLLVLSLLGDGVTATVQSKMRESKVKPSSDEMMLYMNGFAIAFVGAALLVSGTIIPAISFCFNHPEVIVDIMILCFCMSVGQIFIYWCIASYGPLMCSIITTTRKFFTILFSVFWYGHHMSGIQWMCIFVVFVGLMWEILVEEVENYFKKNQHKKK